MAECLECGEPAKWEHPVTSGDRLCDTCAVVAHIECRDEAIEACDWFFAALINSRPEIT